MIRVVFPVVVLLAACGVDGKPVAPKDAEKAPASGVTISGSVEVGVARQF